MVTVGIDWGMHSHHYAILSDTGEVVKEDSIPRTVEAITRLVQTIRDRAPEDGQAEVGIDRKDCVVTRLLLAEGVTVYHLNPRSAARAREIFLPAGQKDDSADARVHARLVRANRSGLRPMRARSGRATRLRCLLQHRKSLVKARAGFYQRLNDSLSSWSPALWRLPGELSCQWKQDLLHKWPLGQDLAAAHGNAVNAFVRNHRMGQKTEQAIRQARKGQSLEHGEQMAAFYREQVRSLLDLIQQLTEKIEAAAERIGQLVDQHPRAELFRSLPAGGDLTVAALMVLFRTDEEPKRDWRQYASYAGVSPVTKESGQKRKVIMRKACNEMLRDSLQHLAYATSRQPGCWARQFYQKKRDQGHGHYAALRCLAHVWVKIIYAMWQKDAPYSERHHRERRRQRGNRAS